MNRHNQDELQWMTGKAEDDHQDCEQTHFMKNEFNKKEIVIQ